ncbi:MAG TPA: hypothetical protein VMJ93_10295 [Verrucomicrobiae bacterium]|nr:hypothetical protein [Verrucomicrobiae bacterium]
MTTEIETSEKTQESSLAEDLQVLARAMEQVIENIMTQAKVNEAMVGRLLSLERRVLEMAEKGAGGRREALSRGFLAADERRSGGRTGKF